jgi:hypothetical protein
MSGFPADILTDYLESYRYTRPGGLLLFSFNSMV